MEIKVKDITKGILAIHDFLSLKGIAYKIEFNQTQVNQGHLIHILADLVQILQSKALLDDFLKSVSAN